MGEVRNRDEPVLIGRYELHEKIASGGMATVHLGRLAGPAGFSRPVAIKRLHPQLANDPEFVAMFLDEARLAARILHPNVVPTLDVVASRGEVFLVMEFVQGETLSSLWRKTKALGRRIDPNIVGSVMSNTLHGLHAAHEAKNEQGSSLRLVHRDVSPQNIMVGSDGVARVLDFGVAKALGRIQTTNKGSIKGKFAYMAPEQLSGDPGLDRRVDVFAAGVVCWELLANARLFDGDNEAVVLARVMTEQPAPVSKYNQELPEGIDAVLEKALAHDKDSRYATARDFAIALERVLGVAPPTVVGDWVVSSAGSSIEQRAAKLLEIEKSSNPADDPVVRSVLERARIPSDPPPDLPHATSDASAKSDSPVGRPHQRTILLAAGAFGTAATLIAIVLWGTSRASSATAPTPSSFFEEASSSSATSSTDADSADEGIEAGLPEAATPAIASIASGTRAAHPKTKPTVTKSQSDCVPPYSLDANGHKHWKKECLR